MLIVRRNALLSGGGGLPYDAEIEYLESTGTQYIDTGVSGAEHNLIITAGVRINTFGAYAGGFGNYASEQANCFRLILTQSNNGKAYATCGYMASISSTISNFTLDAWHTVVLNGVYDTCFCDGVESVHGKKFYQGTANANIIVLFTQGSAAAGTWSKQISFFRVELNGVLVRDFIPVRFTNENGQSEGAMYDRVSGELFRNSGTGAFVIGPDAT